MKLKYSINDKIEDLPKSISVEVIINVLEKDHQISRSTFLRDRNIAIDDTTSIPTDRLEIYAALFGCSTDQLKNYPIKKIKPLSERNLSSVAKTVIKKAGLRKS